MEPTGLILDSDFMHGWKKGKVPKEVREKISNTVKNLWKEGKYDNRKHGRVGPNKGKKLGKNPKHSKFMKEYYKTHPHPSKGKKHSNKTKIHWSKIRKGRPPWNKGKFYSKETKNKISKIMLEKWHLAKRPTSLEQKMIKIIKDSNLPYKYVGNGSVLIGFKNPDFVNINGQKVCIEVRHSDVCKIFDKCSPKEYADQRIEHYAKYGWKCLVLFENDFEG